MAKKPTCGHPDRPIFSKGNCKSCATVIYNQRSIERQRENNRAHTMLGVYDPERWKGSSYEGTTFEEFKKSEAPKKTKINPTSDLKKLLDKIYAILSAELKPLHTVCEGNGKLPGCTHIATEIHHKQGRRGILLIMSKKFAYLCRHCHAYCTVHSDKAQELGLSIQINSKIEYDFTERELELIEQFNVRLPKDALFIT